MNNEDIKKCGAIKPFRFIKPGEKIKPFRIEEPSAAISPLAWNAVHEQRDGRCIAVETKDSRLAQHRIPKEVEDPQSYLNHISKILDGKTESSEEQTKTSIIKAVTTGTNLEIIPEEHWFYVDRNGKEIKKKEKIIATIFFTNGKTEKFAILISEISSICKIIKKRYAEAIFDYEEKNLEKRFENEFRSKINQCRKVVCLTDAGWQKINNQWIYIFQSVKLADNYSIETKLDMQVESCTHKELYWIFVNALTMYKDSDVSAVMVAYALMGVLQRPFKEAGYAPHFLLFLNGKSGSLKTTIGKILFTQLSEQQFRDIPRRIDADTAVSLERGIVTSGRDTIILLDDFAPAKSEAKKKEYADKLEMIVRMVGDGSSKSRSNIDLEDCRGEGVQGMIVVTGELMGQGMSSNLRCFYCRMEREKADLQMVTYFQENPYAITTLIVKFAEYIGKYWEKIQTYIKREFKKKREEISKILKEKRLVDSVVSLHIACDIFVGFMLEKQGCEEEYFAYLIESMKKGIISCAIQSQAVSVEESPVLQYLRALDSLEKTGVIKLKNNRLSVTELGIFDGFVEDGFLFLNPEKVHAKILTFLRNVKKYFPYDVSEMANILADDGILQTSSNGKGKRILKARVQVIDGERCNFFKIKFCDYQRIIASEDESLFE